MSNIFNDSEITKLDSEKRKKIVPPYLVLDEINLKKGDCLIDVGVGTGYFALPALARIGETGKLYAVDISDTMLEVFQKNISGYSNVEIIKVSNVSIPIKDLTADILLLAFVFHEIGDKKLYSKELHRLVKKDGRIVIVEWDYVESPMGPPLTERIKHEDVQVIFEGIKMTLEKHVKINEYQYLDIYIK